MHLMPSSTEGRTDEMEILLLSEEHLDYLGQVAREMNPDMPESFGLPYLIRTILDRIEQSGIDLTAACSEEDIALLVARRLRAEADRRRIPRPNERLFSSAPNRSGSPRSRRSNRPATDRFRSGSIPRSVRG